MVSGASLKQFLRDLKQEINDDNVFTGGAALGFYLTLAIFPAIILLLTAVPYLPIDNVDKAILDMLRQALPASSFQMLQGVVTEIANNRRGGLLSFSLLGTLWAASSGMYAIMQQLNITYEVKEGRSFFRARAIAIILSILFGSLIIGAFSLIVLGGTIESWIANRFGSSQFLLMFFVVFRWVVIVLGLLLGFALVYKYAPNVEQKFVFITPGSVTGVTLLIVASLLFSFYTGNFANYDATYGSLGAMIMLMLWLYIAGLVILIGSEINALLEHYSEEGKRKGEKRERANSSGTNPQC